MRVTCEFIESAAEQSIQGICDCISVLRSIFPVYSRIKCVSRICVYLDHKTMDFKCAIQIFFDLELLIQMTVCIAKPLSIIPNGSLVFRIPEILIATKLWVPKI